MIILTSEQADTVRGLNADATAALEPRPLADGAFALPEAVLADPAHIEHHALLDTLPQRAVEEHEWLHQPGEAEE